MRINLITGCNTPAPCWIRMQNWHCLKDTCEVLASGVQVVVILQKFYSNSENALGLNLSSELIMRVWHCSKWVGGQAPGAFICQKCW
ncbi:Serine/Threonine-Protein Phosphatase 4 Regulatory Subunit 1 [Manis pentadactyla]|nr:Serine/Threonine-Protein Phosphatase 4 Regulatory Subunit 1 [Manis pentadactyla]